MNNERYNQIIDEVYMKYIQHTVLGVNNGFDRIQGHLDNCLVEYDGYYEYFTNPSFQYGYRPHRKEKFINKCKTSPEFSERWGLKIIERELSLEERRKLANYESEFVSPMTVESWDRNNIPSKLITFTYKDEKIEIYE